MPNRREFLSAAAGAFLASRVLMNASTQNPAVRRREVSIGNRRIKVIDIHGHFIAPEELELIRGTNLAGNISGQPASLILDAGPPADSG